MFIVICVSLHIRHDDPDFPTAGWTDIAGEDETPWTFDNESEAQQLARYLNSPHYDYALWRYRCDWYWIVMPLAQFQKLVPDEKGFEPVPGHIKAEVAERVQQAKQTSVYSLRQEYYEFCYSISPFSATCVRVFADGAGSFADGAKKNSYDLGELEQK